MPWSRALDNKRVLQVAVVGSLLVMAALGEWQLTLRSWSLMRRALLAQTLAYDAALARTLAGVLGQVAPGATSEDAQARHLAQRVVEHLDLGSGAYALIVDRDGVILAHPIAAYVGARLPGPFGAERPSQPRWLRDPSDGRRRWLVPYWSPQLGAAVCIVQDPRVQAAQAHRLGALFVRTTFLLWIAFLIAVWFAVGSLVERYESRFADFARTDALTGLGNRRALDELLARAGARRRGGDRGWAAIALDLDDFKPINDTYGHAAGDRVLIALAERLRAMAPGLAFRLGGDEFLILAADVTEDQAANELERVRRCFPLAIAGNDGQPLSVAGSAGFAFWERGQTPAELLANADRALYLQKSVRKKGARTLAGRAAVS